MTMAVADRHHKPHADVKLFRLCPIWQSGNNTSSSSSSTQNLHYSSHNRSDRNSTALNNLKASSSSKTVSSVAKSLLPPRRRLRLDPSNCLFFPCEFLFSLSLSFDAGV